MDKRVTKCLGTIREAFKTLVASANNETDMVGLVMTALTKMQDIYEEAMDEGCAEFEKKGKIGDRQAQ